MSKITYPNKATGDTFSGAEATEIKTIVNTNDDELIALSGEVDLNTDKVGITTEQSNEITANTSKVGITTQQAADITDNNDKISYTDSIAVGLNTLKVGVTNEEANTIDSEPIGNEVQVLQVVSITQADYDLITPVATTFYIISA